MSSSIPPVSTPQLDSALAKSSTRRAPQRTRIGLNLANFLLAELMGIVLPLLGDYLRSHGWEYGQIGLATAMTGLGLLCAQLPVGMFIDRCRYYRGMLISASVLVGATFGVIPWLVDYHGLLYMVLLISGIGQAFIFGLLAALPLALAGKAGVNRLMGENQAWNHTGNVVAGVGILAMVAHFGTSTIFYLTGTISLFAAAACLLMRPRDLHCEAMATTEVWQWRGMLKDRRLLILLASIAVFHVVNGSITPTVALYSASLGRSAQDVAALLFAAQLSMIGVAAAAGRLGDRMGRKFTMTIAFLALPLRTALYAFVANPKYFLPIQILDGMGWGTYAVIITSICADLDNGRNRFNTLMGLTAMVFALGNAVGPAAAGFMVQRWDFVPTLYIFAGLALAGALFFIAFMPETHTRAARVRALVDLQARREDGAKCPADR